MTYIAQGHDAGARRRDRFGDIKPGRRLGPEPVSTLRRLHPAQRPTDRSRRIPVSNSVNLRSPRRTHAFGRSPSVTRQSEFGPTMEKSNV